MILRLLSKYGLPATFFVPGYTAERYVHLAEAIAGAGHEIGHHGYLCEPLNLLALEERRMIEHGLEAIERVVGLRRRGFRSPSAELSASTFDLLLEY